jgi:hypothetical protein
MLSETTPPRTIATATKTSHHAVTDADYYLRADAAAGVVTFTLPSAAGREGRTYVFKKIDRSSFPVLLQCQPGERIHDRPVLLLPGPNNAIMVRSNGTDWEVSGGA